jgi:predicted secreted protein with PEFG-CTERM motif
MEYKAYALVAILLGSVLALGAMGTAAYAQTGGLTVSTDKTAYGTGDTIKISGNVGVTPTGQPLVLRVFNPNGAAYRFDQVNIAADGSYTYDLKVGGNLGVTGPYKVSVSYNGASKDTTFTFTAAPGGGGVAGWQTAKLKLGDKTYDIKYQITGGSLKNMTGDPGTTTITAMINATADGNLKIQLPRNIADAKNANGTDTDYVIFVDNVEDFADDDHGNATRTLTVQFTGGAEQIDIVGTSLVPEFGAIAAIVLAVSIVGIIVATTKYSKFSFVPKM